MRTLITLLAFISIGSAAAADLKDDVIDNLTTMRSVYRAQYAPADWKKSFAGYELDKEYDKAVAAVKADDSLTLKEARQILKDFIYAMKDYHVSISFHSTEMAQLPFTVKGTKDQLFIMYIDRKKLPRDTFPFEVGDELVTFDGKPAMEAVAAVQAETLPNVPSTDKALAELALTLRRGARGYKIPQGPITIGVKRQGSSSVTNHQIIWEYTPERIKDRGNLAKVARKTSVSSILNPMMDADVLDLDDSLNPYNRGGKKTFTPALGTKVWESSDSDLFHSYIYKAEGGKLIGYIRIASYVMNDYGKAVAEFGRTMALFNSTTDALVIDQVDNPGGSVFYLYALASMLAKEPLKTPLHRMSITQADVVEALQAIEIFDRVRSDDEAREVLGAEGLSGYPASYEFAQFYLNFARFIVSEWEAGKKLTSPYWIAGVDQINPAPNAYTKPVLLLTNELDFSGGDFFPAILQDNKRVTTLGTRTAGAGGYVLTNETPNNIGVSAFRCTASLAERVSRDPIENLGVTPDIAYSMTATDYQTGYSSYTKAIRETVLSLIP